MSAPRPAREGNAPRVGGYVAWHCEEPQLGYARLGLRARVLRCGTGTDDTLIVSVQGGPPHEVRYADVYPCEAPA